jgi:hypothetical protein
VRMCVRAVRVCVRVRMCVRACAYVCVCVCRSIVCRLVDTAGALRPHRTRPSGMGRSAVGRSLSTYLLSTYLVLGMGSPGRYTWSSEYACAGAISIYRSVCIYVRRSRAAVCSQPVPT